MDAFQVATFAVNYIGHPFNQSIRENRPFFYALGSAAIFFTAITSDVFRSLNDWLRLVPLPKPFGHHLLFMALAMMICCYLWEHSLRWLFPAKMPTLRPRQRRRLTKELVSKKVKWVICIWEGVRVIQKNQVVGNLCSTSKAYAVCYHCLPCNKYMQNWKELQCGQVSWVTDYSTWVGCSTGRGQGVLCLVEADFSVL